MPDPILLAPPNRRGSDLTTALLMQLARPQEQARGSALAQTATGGLRGAITAMALQREQERIAQANAERAQQQEALARATAATVGGVPGWKNPDYGTPAGVGTGPGIPAVPPGAQGLAAGLQANPQAVSQLPALSRLAQTMTPKPAAPFTLGPGQQRFDPTGNPIATVAPKPDLTNLQREAQGLYPNDPAKQRAFIESVRKKAGVSITNEGSIPPGYRVNRDTEGRAVSMEPLPGSPAAIKQEQEAADQTRREDVDTETKITKASTMLDATKSIEEEIKSAKLPAVGTASRPFALYSGSSAGRVRSYLGALKSGVVLGAMQRLKAASATGATGFGAMNRSELQILIDDIGALDPDNTEPDIFLKTIDRIKERYNRVIDDVRRNVSTTRIKELGLEDVMGFVKEGGRPNTGGWSVEPAE